MTRFGHITIKGTVSAPGPYLLRVHYNPYWTLSGAGCVTRGPARMTVLHLTMPGPFSLTVPATPDGLLDAATVAHGTRC